MSDETPTPATPAAPAKSSSGSGFAWGSVISGGLGLVGAAAGAGWPGIIAMAALGLAAPFIWNIVVGMFNKWSDSRDLERAGADAGKTAVDLANQGREVSGGLDAGQAGSPPTKGFPEK